MVTRPQGDGLTRAQLVRRAGTTAAALALAGTVPPYAFAGPLRHRGRSLAGELSVVQWSHVVPAYDAWFDDWAARWGETHDVEVSVDHVEYTRLPALAATEAKAGRGHDVFGFLSPPAAFEDDVIDHADVVREVERAVGPYGELGRRSTYNPRTKRYFGVSDGYVPAPTVWRHDLWDSVGESPATWENVHRGAPRLKELGHPIGIGQSNEPESNTALLSFLTSLGSSVQDASGAVAIRSTSTVEAVELMADLYRTGEESEIFAWSPASNNQLLLGGRGSLVQNAISAVRTAEDLRLPIADDLWLWPIPAGPGPRRALPQHTSVYAIWTFTRNREAAERFVADLCIGYEQATLASRLFNFPSFPGAFPAKKLYAAAAADTHAPRGKYTILATIAAKHTVNVGYPGYANAAVDEMLGRFLIPHMFAGVSQGKLSAADSVRSTARQLERIWARWRDAGKV